MKMRDIKKKPVAFLAPGKKKPLKLEESVSVRQESLRKQKINLLFTVTRVYSLKKKKKKKTLKNCYKSYRVHCYNIRYKPECLKGNNF